MIKTVNPATNKVIQDYEVMNTTQARAVVDECHTAFADWRDLTFPERAVFMNKLADILDAEKGDLARLMTEEMGKVRAQGIAEIEKCASACRYYAENAETFLTNDTIQSDFKESLVTYQPIGVVMAIMPWNFPFWQVLRFAAPTLMTGNIAVLKHASSVTGCALKIEEMFRQAGFPQNVFRTIIVPGAEMEEVIKHPHVRAISLTGSTDAGRKVASVAGQYLKKCVLELGGSDAYLVLADADIELAAQQCVQSRLQNAGQSCIAAKRFIVVDDIYGGFIERFQKVMKSKVMGDPLGDHTDIGPMASVSLRDELHDQVRKSIASGAECLLGGEVPDQDGAWYPPTILTNVQKGMPAYDEELFGPVASVIRVSDEAEAIAVANASEFGLGGGVFSRDIKRAKHIAEKSLDTGNVAINGFVKSNPALPFGGVKDSGYGRELSHFGIKEFVNIKAVTVQN